MFGFRKYHTALQSRLHSLSGHVVIDAPAQVFGAGIGTVTPPSILVRFFIEFTKSIYKARANESTHPFALFRKKTGGIFIAHRVMDIYGLEYILYLSSPVKIGILSFSGILGLVTLGYWVVYPGYQLYKNERYLSDEEAAEQIGKYFTEIDDKLLNIIQLSKLKSKENELILASINQKAKALSVIPFVQSIDLKKRTLATCLTSIGR